ncbi:bifunctional acetate--CoA ligase family protein/GNAT family N-acetyltransferase [Nesterenkonia halotolerans]|uniref:Acyl-CoA synthetase (NDP forming)/RimJ/RimL family protein N-acetyltransferase n=1 Tax=Nesterenkonia halotolerans TaxID=225325 RepID=A0ABR9J399_9MICC|nr:bifunctional GNAT family N-acetyltransferase/acetate--CoA ligase family protein [Nesterenkonia halotolerans]MBE1513472.1 acyl-CoA synthetase (NDP forming)/RimJ/RimL family protein N-acetyltransferase [Nesterenkonia halotolerans]
MGESPRTGGYPAHWEADVVLRDGAAAHLRPISPQDSERLQRMHAAQSDSSIYLRYFTFKSALTEKELIRFTQVDHVDRVAMVILLDEEIIGVGGFDRIDDTSEAEVSFNISDKHQGRGLGSVLLEHLAAAGRERGLERFSAEVLPENRKMLTVFSEAGYETQRRFEDGVVMLEFPIDPTEKSRAVMEAREHRAESRSVAELLAPEQVAVIGASREYGSVGYHLVQNLIEGHFTGGVHSVNPEAFEVGGVQASASLAHIKQQIDLAVVAVPAEQLAEVVADCGRNGVKGILVVTAPELGAQAEEQDHRPFDQRELVRLARRWGMRVIGPASVGLMNTDPDVSLNASLSPTMPLRGGVGLFSQSASIGVSLFAQANRRELGLSSVISAGNRADLSGNDAMQYFEDDDSTRAVGVYLESFGNPRKFSRIARRLSRTKPVVVAKSDVMGRSLPPGHEVRTTRAPMGAVDSMLEHSGVIQVGNHDSLMDVLQVLATQPLPGGDRIGILSNSPSMGRILADTAETLGLTAVRVVGDLDLDLPRAAADAALAGALEELFIAEDIDAVALCLQPAVTGEHYDHSRLISQTARQHTKPMVASWIGVLDASVPLNHIGNAALVIEDGSLQQGFPVFSSPERSLVALAKIVRYQRWRSAGIGEAYVPKGLEGTAASRRGDELLDGWLDGVQGAQLESLDADRCAELLGVYGMSMLRSVAFSTEEEALAAAEALGYPVAVKSTNTYLRHRLDLGGVQLNIEDPEGLRRAIAEMRHVLADYGAAGLELQSMAPAGQGCVVRAIEDPLMGPVVSFGLSGDAVELLDDWAHAVPPLTDQDLRGLVRRPRAAKRLFGYKGVPAVDIAGLEDTLQRVAMLKDNHPQVASLELTPVLASPEGVQVLHAAIEIANPEQRTDSARRAISRY